MADILLVEDEPAHAELVRRAFDRYGEQFRLVIAATLQEARSQVAAGRFSLIITDWRLPDGEGTELIDAHVPVVVMTSHGSERLAVDAIKAGALDYLVKSDSALMDMPHVAERALREWNHVIQRRAVEDELRLRVSDLEAVSRLSTALRTADTLEDMVARLMDETLALMNTAHGGLWLYHAVAGKLVRVAARGNSEAGFAPTIEANECIIGKSFSSSMSVAAKEFITDPNLDSRNTTIQPGWGGVCLPIHTAHETIGVLLIGVELPREITLREQNLLTTLAEIAGNAVHRTQLHEQTQKSLHRLSALRAIDQAITGSMDMRLSLSILTEQARTQLNVDAVSVLTLDSNGQMLEYCIGRGFDTKFAARTRLRLGEGYAGVAALERRPIFAPDLSVTGSATGRHELSTSEFFRAYYVVPLIAKGHVKGVLEIFHRSPLQPEPDWVNFLEALAGQAAIAIENAELFETIQRSNTELIMAYDATIEGWSRALDLRDHETEGHTQRVTDITIRLARAVGVPEEALIHIHRGALLHDIGKMGVPDNILLKPGPLTDEEWVSMRKHPQYAYEMLYPIHYLRPALDIPYCHHERMDGSGYPRGIKGDGIPLAARIFSIVDVWDALRSDRPYRAAWSDEKIKEYITGRAATHFDRDVVSVFMALIQ
ncbi:MAG: hypothetical protein HFACDABA_01117 [Anaerolineales bacterium]|nr:hypothetical protein [Anaerolineales bacterium]